MRQGLPLTTLVAVTALLTVSLSLSLQWMMTADDALPYMHKTDGISFSLNDEDDGETDRHEAEARTSSSAEIQANLVVVAGAWRRPNGTLSKAFENRVVHGLRVAMLLRAPHLLLTGGLNDSAIAREYAYTLRNASGVIFPQKLLRSLAPHASSVAARLRQHLEPYDHLSLGAALEVLRKDDGRWPDLHIENVSLTTFTNAVETRRWLEDSGALSPGNTDLCQRPLSVVVVTSQYHARRCQLLFTKALHAQPYSGGGASKGSCGRIDLPHKFIRVYTSGTTAHMGELLTPPEWISFADVPPPSMQSIHFVPHAVKVLCNTIYITYRNWRTHLHVSLFSWESYALLRELGSFAKALVLGLITPREILSSVIGAW